MRRLVLSILVSSCVAASAYAQTEALERLATQLKEAPAGNNPADTSIRQPLKPFAVTEHILDNAGSSVSVSLPATETVRYQYDDNSFETGVGVTGYAVQVAQQFQLRDSGRTRWLEACFWQYSSDSTSAHAFAFDILSDRSGSPGTSLVGEMRLLKDGTVASSPADTCFRLNYSQRLSGETVWVAVFFFGDDGLRQNGLSGLGKLLSTDTGSPRNTTVRARTIEGSGAQVTGVGSWRSITEANAVGIRMAVDHEAADPDPEPDPEPEDDAPCDAAGEGVNLLGHQVFMCIVASGEVHQLKAEQLSSKVAIFGRRSDPKAVIKLVGGCTWGAIAAVTTARKLQIRVYNTANGKEWEHNHSSSGLAPSGHSGSALCDQ